MVSWALALVACSRQLGAVIKYPIIGAASTFIGGILTSSTIRVAVDAFAILSELANGASIGACTVLSEEFGFFTCGTCAGDTAFFNEVGTSGAAVDAWGTFLGGIIAITDQVLAFGA
jgi:hypothetical protein